MKNKPCLVNVVGIDGAGKTSICETLNLALNAQNLKSCIVEANPFNFKEYIEFKDFLKEIKSLGMKLPSRYFVSILVSESTVPLRKVIDSMEDYDVIICDRYIEKVLEFLEVRGLDYSHVKEHIGLVPTPDYIFFIDVPVKTAVERILQRDGNMRHHKHMDFFMLREKYLEWSTKKDYIVIDGTQSIDEIVHQILIKIGYAKVIKQFRKSGA